MMKKILLAILAAVVAVGACAQNAYVNHDAEVLHGLKGPVKKAVITEGKYLPLTYEYDQTGKYLKSKNTVTRDSHGYIVKEVTPEHRRTTNSKQSIYVYEYDPQHRLKTTKTYGVTNNGTVLDHTVTYTYDANGRRTSWVSSSDKTIHTYKYNSKGELVEAVATSKEGKVLKREKRSNIVTDKYGNAVKYTVDMSNGDRYDVNVDITYYGGQPTSAKPAQPAQPASKASASAWDKFSGKNLRLVQYVFPDGRKGTSPNEVLNFNLNSGTYKWTGQQNNRSTSGRIAINGNKLTIYDGSKPFDTWTIVSYDPATRALQVKCTYLNLTRYLTVN